METPTTITNQLTDIAGLRLSGVFPKGKEPSLRTLREWTRTRRIPYYKVSHFTYYNPLEVSQHIRTKCKIHPRGGLSE
jgi:hypothetical protein